MRWTWDFPHKQTYYLPCNIDTLILLVVYHYGCQHILWWKNVPGLENYNMLLNSSGYIVSSNKVFPYLHIGLPLIYANFQYDTLCSFICMGCLFTPCYLCVHWARIRLRAANGFVALYWSILAWNYRSTQFNTHRQMRQLRTIRSGPSGQPTLHCTRNLAPPDVITCICKLPQCRCAVSFFLYQSAIPST